jgi:hypothetical protein
MLVVGKSLPVFASKEKWQELGGIDVQQEENELLLDIFDDGMQMAFEDKLPGGSQQLALRMLEHTLSWFLPVFNSLSAMDGRDHPLLN